MGSRGSFARGDADTEEGRKYKGLFWIGDVKVLEYDGKTAKLPEESHTANRIYATFYKDGHDVKEIAKYGPNGLKQWAIHTAKHDDLFDHYHPWRDGSPIIDEVTHKNKALPLTPEMEVILNKLRTFGK